MFNLYLPIWDIRSNPGENTIWVCLKIGDIPLPSGKLTKFTMENPPMFHG